MTLRVLTTTAVAALVAAGFVSTSARTPDPPKPALGTFGVDLAQMDRSVKPGDDFFAYVNGKWIATVAMPADKSRYGMFDALSDRAEVDVRTLVTELAATTPPAGSVQQKVADLYASWMDEAGVEARGLEPLKADLAAIDAATSKTDLVRLMGRVDFAGAVRDLHLCRTRPTRRATP